jgi:hypothetical protein
LVSDGEVENINVCAVDVASLSGKSQGSCEAVLAVFNVRGLVTRTDALRNFGLGILDVGNQVCAIIDGGWESELGSETSPKGQHLGRRCVYTRNLRRISSIDQN